MTRSQLIAATTASLTLGVATFALTTQDGTAAPSGSKPIPAQRARKQQDSAQTRRAKETQRLKAAQSRAAAIPAGLTGTWAIDPNHSTVGFAIRHVVINDVHGTFNEFEGTIKADARNVSKSSVEFKAKVASIDTNVARRDTHLKSPDFFDAAKYPEIKFKSTRIVRTDDGFRAIGYFSMHGVTKLIVIPFTLSGPVVDGFGFTRLGVAGDLQLNRQDYGVKWNQKLDNGGMMLDNIVRVHLDLEAIKAGSGPKKPG